MSDASDTDRFEILLAWSDRVLSVGPGESALEALTAAGVPIDSECHGGWCGTCITDYVEGDIVHYDLCLRPPDRERQFCPCVSRARSRIVLAF